MGDVIAIIVIAIIMIGAILYIIKSKKSGKKCIGCPYACSCNKKGENDCGENVKSNSAK